MGNRVEDLERQVAELQAAVDGLTEELVESKERLRQLESATEFSVEAATDGADRSNAEFVPRGDATADEETDEAATEGEEEEDDADGSDDGIIVA